MSPALVTALVALAAAQGRASLVFAGDLIPHDGVKQTAQAHALSARLPFAKLPISRNHAGWDHVLGPVTAALRTADVAFLNLETPITDDPDAVTAQMLFNAPSALAAALAAAGVDVVSIANNHAWDQHTPGITETRAHLLAAGVASLGAGASYDEAWQPVVLERGGLKVGFLAATRWTNGFANGRHDRPTVAVARYPQEDPNGFTRAALLMSVRQAARRCEALVVSMHWGDEYVAAPRPADRTLARELVEAGALLVVGHHPHVLQPVEVLEAGGRRALVAWSLGNLVSNQAYGYQFGKDPALEARQRDGMLLEVRLAKVDGAVRVEGARALPLWTENNHLARVGPKPPTRNIQPVLLDDELTDVAERLAELRERPAEATGPEARALEERQALALERRRLILELVPPELRGTQARAGAEASGR